MPELFMVSHKLQDMQFINRLEKPGEVQLSNNFSFSVDYTHDNRRCVAKLYQCVKDKTGDENHKFFVAVEMIGVFDIVGPVTDEDKKDLHVQTYQQLFPYAEVLVKQLCAAGGMPNFVLLRNRMSRDRVVVKQNNP